MNNTLGNNILKTFRLAFLFAFVTAFCFGQTLLTTTTISAAVTQTQNTVTLASGTGVTIPGAANQINTVLYIDRELMRVTGLVSGTTYNVQRGITTRQHAHLSGATVWIGSPTGNFLSTEYFAEAAGTCVAVSESLPRIYLRSGHKYDCMGVAGTQQWVLTSSPDLPILGSTVASAAGVITGTGTIFLVSGTAAITGLTVPNGMAPGMCLTLIPTGAWTLTTATNIRTAATAVSGKAMLMCWDGSKFDSSY